MPQIKQVHHRIYLLLEILLLSASFVSAEERRQKTTLRVQGYPVGTFKSDSKATYIIHAQVEIRNTSRWPATKVQVEVVLPDGRVVTLRGTKTLKANCTATYTRKLNEIVTSDRKLTAKVTCNNCR